MSVRKTDERGIGGEMISLAISDLEEIATTQKSVELGAVVANMKSGKVAPAEPVFRSIADTYLETKGVDVELQVQALRNLAAVQQHRDQQKATNTLEQALALQPDEPQLLVFLAQLHLQAKRFDAAQPLLERLLTQKADGDNQQWRAIAQETLGIIHHFKGRLVGAIACYEAAIEGFSRLGDEIRRAESMGNLGLVYRRTGDLDRAEGLFAEALEIWRTRDFEKETVRMLGYLASVHFAKGNYNDAIDLFSERIQFNEALRDREEMAADHANIGQSFHKKGRSKNACNHWHKAFSIYGQLQGCEREVKSIAALLQANGFELDQPAA